MELNKQLVARAKRANLSVEWLDASQNMATTCNECEQVWFVDNKTTQWMKCPNGCNAELMSDDGGG